MLYPVQNERRIKFDLSGIWNVEIQNKKNSTVKEFTIAVPASLNDQILDVDIRNHVGDFHFKKKFFMNPNLIDERIVLRFGSVTQSAKVFLNENFLVEHYGGFTPFEVDITNYVICGENLLEVVVNNILDETTLPVGCHIKTGNNEKVIPMFDFYNYCGINRPVSIYTTSKTYIKDIVIDYDVKGNRTMISPLITIIGEYHKISLEIIDEEGKTIASAYSKHASLIIENTNKWEPLNAYLYTLKVRLLDEEDKLIDTYSEEFGIRTIEIKNNQLLINNKPIYLKGFGRHEDFPVLGKGMNEAIMNFDHNAMKWIGANSYRTSHYPYSEEEMRLADRNGFIVIDEVPGVGLYSRFNPDVTKNVNDINTWEQMKTKDAHISVINELVKRDKNHPSVIAWAIANEPAGHQKGAKEYFEPLFNQIRELDHEKRPVIVPNIVNATPESDQITQFTDIICLNRYYGWYIDHGELDLSILKLEDEIKKWHSLYPEKPIMITEFGVDTVPGIHSIYSAPYSEEFQIEFYKRTFEILDKLDYVIGEHLWNFADFSTASNIRRIDGNLKGIFSRDRRPKSIVEFIKNRWQDKVTTK
ncbi:MULTISPECIES: beta-glucuronidase [unclassified Facklamia]|uniref:beta-glucuronidase n=1 Tax=Aerococcaceae TaxID=186827 RepID=UPI0013BA0FCF|nr:MULTISPECIES: beta-glucuronidase [unclassified Facklamia]NEW64588.1 beta-glucuronidase [Facklamia sp. 252]NEW67913.1 beta-glucuronidase [Facklamia sp. 253]QQD65401.1 beta-glucuronidase [Aerococcaceae bacterium zg-252]